MSFFLSSSRDAPPGSAPATASDSPESSRHRHHEDRQALRTDSLFVALGVIMFRHTGLLTGGTAGLAFLTHYCFGPLMYEPFTLSLSKGCNGFDRLSPNGIKTSVGRIYRPAAGT